MLVRFLSFTLATLLCLPAYASDTQQEDAQAMPSEQRAPLEGSVTYSARYSFKNHLSDLLDTAEKQNPDIRLYQQAVDKYDTMPRKVVDRTVDTLNYTLMFRGITPSCEAGDVVLGEKEKLKSLASAKYLKQKAQDELRLKVLSDVMQMAMIMGNSASENDGQLQAAKKRLVDLVGEKQAEKTVGFLNDLMRDRATSQEQAAEQPWSAAETQKRIASALESAALTDPVIKDIEADVHHYNRHSSAVLAGQRVVRVCLSALGLTPSIVGPAAQATLFGFLLVTGGPEQDKVLKELYLDKRLTSRAHLLTEEAHLAVENYQLGALTNNKLLMACSEQLLANLTDQNTAARLISTDNTNASATEAAANNAN